MNRCRTCQHWSAHPAMLGVGCCVNFQAQLRVTTDNGVLRTAQDFGCPFHEPGPCTAEIAPVEKQLETLSDFARSRFGKGLI